MDKPVLTTQQQTNNPKKKFFGVFVLVALAAVILIVIGGLAYGIGKISDFSENIKAGDYQKSIQNIIFQNTNIGPTSKNINRSSGNGSQLDIMLAPNEVGTNSAQRPPCSDSDAHLKPNDIYVKGIIKDFRGKEMSADQCADSRFVIETECQPDDNGSGSYAISSTRHECLTMCDDGACVIGDNSLGVNSPTNQAPKKPSENMRNDCLDSDAGLSPRDIYSPGDVALLKEGIIISSAHDSCRNNFTVEEVKCRKGTNGDNSYYLQRIPYPCPKGCLNGACEE